MTDELPQTVKDSVIGKIPLGNFGHPQDIAAVVTFLASAEARYITGQVISVDGGMTM
jgi:3-oxoacyl-[acyl-carrier protein] reductase